MIASFMRAPLPTGPTCSTRRQSWSRTGFARATSAASPPTKPMQLAVARRRRRAADRDNRRAPRLSRPPSRASFSIASGRTVLISTKSLPVHVPGEQTRIAARTSPRSPRASVRMRDHELARARELARRRRDFRARPRRAASFSPASGSRRSLRDPRSSAAAPSQRPSCRFRRYRFSKCFSCLSPCERFDARAI